MPSVKLFTDGACSGNPGPGGWAYILIHSETGKSKKESGSEKITTNNRMEMLAVIRGLQCLSKPCSVEVVTDSEYVANGISKWMQKWKKKGWMRNRKRPVLNVDLWKQLDSLTEHHAVICSTVRGHSGHPENEECDRMAVEAIESWNETGT